MIGQFGPVKIETPGTVGFQQIDHRAAPVAAFAVDMFKEVERQRPRPVEQQHIALLQCVDVVAGHRREQRFHPPAQVGRHKSFTVQNLADRRNGGLKLFARIGKKR